ncbi:transposase [Psychrobacter submarinus]|uniref:transposase n=1 Tax=Psychrobacter submarinus TaxID=154108 RepID=UPI002234D2F6|nr:transposase [Psychrobacter submarinus]
MTNQSDIKKLAEQMASSMKSFDDIKDFQKQLMQSFIDTALEAEMEEHLSATPSMKKQTSLISAMDTLKTVRSDTGDLEISNPKRP